MEMLTGSEASVRSHAARALATYTNHGVTRKLIKIALNEKTDTAIRIATIGALQNLLDKNAVDALVQLLDEENAAIRSAALKALEGLTNISAFGNDTSRWKQWWARNKNKPRTVWLADLANSLAVSKSALEAENAKLQSRLAQAIVDLYTTTPRPQRDALLVGLMKDPVVPVRLAAMELVERQIASGETISADLRKEVRKELSGAEAATRRASALLVAGLGDDESVPALLDRLEMEKTPSVLRALHKAVGQLRVRKAVPLLIRDVASTDGRLTASAAAALGRIAQAQTLDEKLKTSAGEALLKRYAKVAESNNDVETRTSLLVAMGTLGDRAFLDALKGALKDPATRVRLAAVNGLMKLGRKETAQAIKPLLKDPDRGVRQASLVALGRLGGGTYLQDVFSLTDPDSESESAVRRQAWDVSMELLKTASPEAMAEVISTLKKRTDSQAERIKVMEMYVAALKKNRSERLPAAQRALGLALVDAKRPAEGAPKLKDALSHYRDANSPLAGPVWTEWVTALLAANDTSAIQAIGEQKNEPRYARAMELMRERLNALVKGENWSAAILLTEQSLRQLKARLEDTQRKALAAMLSQARKELAAADRKRVSALVSQLTSSDASVRKSARDGLAGMGSRAIGPVLEELDTLLKTKEPNAELEQQLLNVLRQIAPELTGYDASEPAKARREVIERWRKTL
jgi:HEAT repeat protein